MGLIKAALSAVGGNLGDQWKEFFYCDSLDKDILMTRGVKQTSKSSSNKSGHDNIITNGSGIAVADGQCMIIVDQGKIVELCAEPGEYTYDQSTEPTVFSGNLKQSIKESFDNMLKRFSFGGDTAHDQRIYYFNTKEIIDNKFGTPNPIPFRIVDRNLNLDTDVSVRCAGVYSYRIADPVLFYTSIAGNVSEEYRREELEEQLKAEFISALQPSFGKLSGLGLRPSELPTHVEELCAYMNETLDVKWGQGRGLEIVNVAINSVTLPPEDQEKIKNLQMAAVLRDPNMAAASIATAQSEAMRTAAGNEAGAAIGFMGMGMAMNAGSNAQNLFAMGQQQNPQTYQPQGYQQPAQGSQPIQGEQPQVGAPNAAGAKFCSNCGANVEGAKFCANCGKPTGN